MKCNTVHTKLAGYLDDAVTGAALVEERVLIREHLEACDYCREELQRYRKLSMLLSRVPRNLPPADLAVRIRVAAAQAVPTQDLRGRMSSTTSSLPFPTVCSLMSPWIRTVKWSATKLFPARTVSTCAISSIR